MYRNEEYRKYQYFSLPDWQGGIYASPTFAGSRGGSIIAMTWATMLYFGQDGYVKSTKEVIDKTEYIHRE
jgi:sphinganine-1-phosphate aldolase